MGTYPSASSASRTQQPSTVMRDDDLIPVSNSCCSLSFAASNILYGVFMMVGALLAILLKYVDPNSLFDGYFAFDVCQTAVCFGNQAIYRVSFALAIFFMFTLLICSWTPQFHTSSWFWKILVYSALTTGSFFIPGSVYVVYREISRYVSFFYLLVQVLILINLVYTIHGYLVDKIDNHEDATKYRWIYIALFFVSCAFAITGVGLLYHFYGNCPLHNGIISSILVLGVLCILGSSTATVNKGALTPALLLAYCIFLCYQALQSNPDLECNVYAADDVPVWQLILMLAFNIITIGWNSQRTAVGVSDLFHAEKVRKNVTEETTEDQESGNPQNPRKKSNVVQQTDDSQRNHGLMSRSAIISFHFTMALSAFYLAMMLTGWGSELTTRVQNSDASEQSFWIKNVNIWVTYVLYIWTLVIPLCCTSRDFS